jgi:hypothetical protein
VGDPGRGRHRGVASAVLLASYSSLNAAKFAVLGELEAGLPVKLFTREREVYKQNRRVSFAKIERLIPLCFILLK